MIDVRSSKPYIAVPVEYSSSLDPERTPGASRKLGMPKQQFTMFTLPRRTDTEYRAVNLYALDHTRHARTHEKERYEETNGDSKPCMDTSVYSQYKTYKKDTMPMGYV